jgi:hypothetical protein
VLFATPGAGYGSGWLGHLHNKTLGVPAMTVVGSVPTRQAAMSGRVEAISLKPGSTRALTQYGQPEPSTRLRPVVGYVLLWIEHLHISTFVELAITVAGSMPTTSRAKTGCVVAISLNPASTLMFEQ